MQEGCAFGAKCMQVVFFASCKSECMVARNVDRGLIYPPVYVLQMSCVILLFLLVQTKAR